jgi:hypothetical protein
MMNTIGRKNREVREAKSTGVNKKLFAVSVGEPM